MKEARETREEGEDRKALLEEVEVKEKMLKAITEEVLKYKECDPDVLGRRAMRSLGKGN